MQYLTHERKKKKKNKKNKNKNKNKENKGNQVKNVISRNKSYDKKKTEIKDLTKKIVLKIPKKNIREEV